MHGLQGFGHGGHGALLELADAQIAVTRLDEVVAHAAYFNHGAGEGNHDGLGRVFAEEGKGDFGARLAAHALHGIVYAHAAGGGIVDFDDVVAAFDAGAFGGGVFNGGDHFNEAVFAAHFHTQAAEFAFGGFLHVGVVFEVHVFGVRVEVGNHTFERAFEDFVVGFVLIVVGFHLAVHFGHGAQ